MVLPGMFGSDWSTLEGLLARRSFCGRAQLNLPSKFCACCFPAHIGSVPDTFSSPERALIRLHAHDPTQDTSHCEVYKNEKELDTIRVPRNQ